MIIARLFGAEDITAVEVNALVAREVMLSEPFLSYSGRLYRQPGVRLEVDEARSFIRRSRERYDLVLGTMVDTWAATAAGAFALTENNLYTVEAFHDYLAHLTDGGVLSLTRWHQQPPDQLLRLVSLARATLAELDIPDPSRHLMLVRGRPEGQGLATATLLLKKGAFTDEECRRAEEFAERVGYDVLYTPLTRPEGDLTQLAEAEDPATVWASLKSDVTPTRDDSPFFFQSARLSRLFRPRLAQGEWAKTSLGTTVLLTLVGISLVVVVLFILGPLFLVRRRLAGAAQAGRLPYLLYFAGLGLGFILIEVALVQKSVLFLGHPVYALTVVLFSILLASAMGSALSGRFTDLERSLRRVLPAIAVAVVLYVLFLPAVFYGLVHLEAPWRMGLAAALLAPLGLLMGMPMPNRHPPPRRARSRPRALGVGCERRGFRPGLGRRRHPRHDGGLQRDAPDRGRLVPARSRLFAGRAPRLRRGVTSPDDRPAPALGCMRLSTAPDRDDERPSRSCTPRSTRACAFLDTADAYCLDETEIGHNERLIARALATWSGDRSRIRRRDEGRAHASRGPLDPRRPRPPSRRSLRGQPPRARCRADLPVPAPRASTRARRSPPACALSPVSRTTVRSSSASASATST